MTLPAVTQRCHECAHVVDEDLGRWVIVGENDSGFEWMFLCIFCVREWRQRSLERQGLSLDDINERLNEEYPNSRIRNDPLNFR